MRTHRPAFPIFAATAIVIATVVAACGSTAGTAGPSAEPTSSPSVAPPSAPASPSTTPPSAEPTAPPAIEFRPEEQALLDQLRPDARDDCTPRWTDAPVGSTAGVECRPAEGPAAEVGFYSYADNQAAALAYFALLSEHGVVPMSGDCRLGEPGDAAWAPGDGEESLESDEQFGVVVGGYPFVVLRTGCYVSDGAANVQATCGDGVHVAIRGRTDDIASLFEWAEQAAPDVELSVPSPPGICYYPAS